MSAPTLKYAQFSLHTYQILYEYGLNYNEITHLVRGMIGIQKQYPLESYVVDNEKRMIIMKCCGNKEFVLNYPRMDAMIIS